MGSPTQGMWTCRHGVDGRDWCPDCYGPPGEDPGEWVVRALRAMYADDPGFNEEAVMRKFLQGVQRMETDPEYAAYIRRLADEADADLAGMEEAGYEPPG